MKKKFALAMAMLMTVSALAACSGSGGDGTPQPSESAQESSEPAASPEAREPSNETSSGSAENRVVVTNISGAASTSDPYAHSNLNDRIWQGNVFEPLFSYNGNTGEYEPRVGKEWSVSDDGLTYTMTIFDNITFHSGKHCTSEDIKRSLEYAKESPYNSVYSGCIDRVEIVDDYTVDVILSYPNAAFLHNNDRIFIIDCDVVEEQGSAYGTKVNLSGTGAYYMDHYDPAVEIRLLLWDDYYKGNPTIPGITYKIMTDSSAAVIAFESGELDFLDGMPATNYQALEDSGLYNTYLGQTSQIVNYFVNSHHSDVLGNKLVRQAMAYAVDYEAVNIGSMEGLCTINGKLLLPGLTIGAPLAGTGIIYEYNPEKAMELLAEAGYPDGVDVGGIVCIAGSFHEKIAQIMQASLSEVGITAVVEPMEQVTCIDEMRKGNYGIGVMGTYNMLDADYMAVNYDEVDNPTTAMVKMVNAPDYDWERIHELFGLGRGTTDVDQRLAYYTEMDDIIMDAAVAVPFYHTRLPYAWNKDLIINTDKSYTYQYTHLWDAHWN